MKLKEGFKLRPLGREFIIVGEGRSQVNFNKMISLNDTAAYLWKELSGMDFTVEDMADKLCEQYEVTRKIALVDSMNLALKWIEAELVAVE